MMEQKFEEHESWGLVSAHRLTGGDTTNMFGNNVDFPTTIRIEVRPGMVRHDLGRTWYHGKPTPLITVDLTPHQWAEFMSSLNCGEGTPCTVRYANGKTVERPPKRESEFKKIKSEMEKKFSDVIQKLEASNVQIREILEKKSLNKEDRAKLSGTLDVGLRLIQDSLPFLADSMRESAIKITEETKRNMDAFVQDLSQRHGQVEQIQKAQLELPSPTEVFNNE